MGVFCTFRDILTCRSSPAPTRVLKPTRDRRRALWYVARPHFLLRIAHPHPIRTYSHHFWLVQVANERRQLSLHAQTQSDFWVNWDPFNHRYFESDSCHRHTKYKTVHSGVFLRLSSICAWPPGHANCRAVHPATPGPMGRPGVSGPGAVGVGGPQGPISRGGKAGARRGAELGPPFSSRISSRWEAPTQALQIFTTVT